MSDINISNEKGLRCVASVFNGITRLKPLCNSVGADEGTRTPTSHDTRS
jgi:hypothetical protein